MIPSEIIQKTADRIIGFLTSEIADLQRELKIADAAEDKTARNRIVRKLKGRRDSILITEGITQNLPDSLEFFFYRPSPPDDAKRIKLREEFDAAVRWGFLESAFMDKNTQRNLMEMGLSRREINHLIYKNRVPEISKGVSYDLTVDHILELSQGGTNAVSNLCILPSYLNIYKGRFANIQARIGQEEILAFRPKIQNNRAAIVPVIPGGFREKTEDGDIIRQRMEKLLQRSLHYVYEPS